jgi:ribosomal protein L32
MIQDVTNSQIANAVSRLANTRITNTTILAALAPVLPAEYVLKIEEPSGRLIPTRSWCIQWHGGGEPWTVRTPAVPGKGVAIITDLIGQAIAHAQSSSHDGCTRAERAEQARVAIAALPTCPECGQTVLPHEAAISSVTGHHRDCA